MSTSALLLWAIGRKANTDDLGLKNAGVKVKENGDIAVDEYQINRRAVLFLLFAHANTTAGMLW